MEYDTLGVIPLCRYYRPRGFSAFGQMWPLVFAGTIAIGMSWHSHYLAYTYHTGDTVCAVFGIKVGGALAQVILLLYMGQYLSGGGTALTKNSRH